MPFTNTTWKLQDQFDIGVSYFNKTGCAIYTVETHLRYLDEVKSQASMEIESIIIGSDAKKIWFAHMMLVAGKLCATAEFMTLHYSTRDSRTVEMPTAVQTALKQSEITEKPDWVGRQLGLKKK